MTDKPVRTDISWRAPLVISKLDLFLGFLKIGLLGFGGVAPGARRVIVDERRWMSDAEYAGILAVGQALPGANTVNASVMIGDRAQGVAGAIIAPFSLFLAPLLMLVAVAVLYGRYGDLAPVRGALGAAGCAAAGLVAGTAIRLLTNLRLGKAALVFALLTFVAVGMLRAPLLAALFVVGPFSIYVAWRRLRA